MKIPVICGVIERRILVNYRIDPAVLAAQLPKPFRPKLHQGDGMAGICLIRLRELRPKGLPRWIGVSSENAAHRVAVEWEENGTVKEGVYVRRRDTDSRFNALVGGRLFPGLHSHAKFTVEEYTPNYSVVLESDDGATMMAVRGLLTDAWPASSGFAALAEASTFYEAGSLGYSATREPNRHQGLDLRCQRWKVEPLAITEVRSSYFDDRTLFPENSIRFDCALLMRNIEHEWHGKPDLRA